MALNAVFSLVTGLGLAVGAIPLEALLGVPAGLLVGVGLAVAAFGAGVAVLARQHPLRLGLATVVLAADVTWVVGTAVVLTVGPSALTPLGTDVLIGLGVVVAVLAATEWIGLRRVKTR